MLPIIQLDIVIFDLAFSLESTYQGVPFFRLYIKIGRGITDPDTGAVEGIAVVGVDDTNGQWQYDANADGTWVAYSVSRYCPESEGQIGDIFLLHDLLCPECSINYPRQPSCLTAGIRFKERSG